MTLIISEGDTVPTMRRNRQASFWLRDEADAVLTARTGVTEIRSAILDAIVNRYDAVVRRSLPPLDDEPLAWLERILPAHAFLGVREIALLPACVQDHLAQTGEADPHQVVAGLEALSFAERLAVVDAIERRRSAT